MSIFKKKAKVEGIPGYAAIVAKTYRVMVRTMVVESNLTVNSISTMSVTLRPLKPGQTPKDLAGGATNIAMVVGDASNIIPDGPDAQLVHFNAPNWISVIVAQEGAVYFDLIPVPVFLDPNTGKILRVDVEKFVAEQEPNRRRASIIWGETDGPFAEVHQLLQMPKMVKEVANEVVAMPKLWASAVRDMFKDTPVEPIPEAMRPDMSNHPPIEGVDYGQWVHILAAISANRDRGISADDIAEASGVPRGMWKSVNDGWMKRVQSDWKLGAQYGADIQRIQQELKKNRP